MLTPQYHGAADLLFGPGQLARPAIQVASLSGATSGRFEVAKVLARSFPAYQRYVDDVIAEGFEPAKDFPRGPYPVDRIQQVGFSTVAFVTPGGADGMGTQSKLAQDSDPIIGRVRFSPDNDLDVTEILVRLPPELHEAAGAIVASASVR